MRDLSKNFNYRQDYHYAIYLLFLLIALFIFNLFMEMIGNGISFKKFAVYLVGSLVFFRFYYVALRDLLYTFWGLTLFFLPTLVFVFLDSLSLQSYSFHGTLTFIMIAIHGFIIYLASSPVYYPRVSWWEFDYRYRSDIKMTTISESKENEGRITDIRRGGGCIQSFEEFSLGSIIEIQFDFRFEHYHFDAIIGSISQTVPGRPFSYGVKFLLDTDEKKDLYHLLLLNWRSRTKVKIDEKFLKDSEK